MQQSQAREAYPIFSMQIAKDETSLKCVGAIIDYLRECIESDPMARFIATFDHYAHTRELENGLIDESIQAAQSISFCFGITLPTPQAMAHRPRSIGVVELPEHFFITFMQLPMPVANTAMERWVKAICNQT